MERNGMNGDIDVVYVGGTDVWLGPLFLRNEAPPLLATRHPKTFLDSSLLRYPKKSVVGEALVGQSWQAHDIS